MSSSSSSGKNTKTKISDELQQREKTCNNITVYEYNRPEKDLYDYKDIDTFKKENPFDVKKNCKVFISKGSNKINMDKYKRYYKDVYTPTRCRDAEGFWVGSTVNRNNNFEEGNCWKDIEDGECGELLTNYKLLRKNEYLDGNISRDEVKKARKQCEINPKCHFKRISEYKRDCVSKSRINLNKSSNKLISKSKKSSSSIKSRKENLHHIDIINIEKSLDEFYSGKYAPETAELIGKGNRCVEGYIDSNSNISSSNKSKEQEIEQQNIDVVDPNIESKIDYVNDLIKLENINHDLSLDDFKREYNKYLVEYCQYLIINYDPNNKDNKHELIIYMDDADEFDNYKKEYNIYVETFKKQYNPGYKLNVPSGEHKYYYRYIAIFYNKYFSNYFENYDNIDEYGLKNYKIVQGLFIRYLISKSNPIRKYNYAKKFNYGINLLASSSVSSSSQGATSDKYFLMFYMKDESKFNEFKNKINEGIEFDYSTYFPSYYNDKFDIHITKIEKQYMIYSRFLISHINPNEDENNELLYYINNYSKPLLEEYKKEYKKFTKKHLDIYDYYEIYNKYFTKFFSYQISLEYMYYIKHKITILDPNFKEQYEELAKYITNPNLIKEFKNYYNLLPNNSNYDKELLNLYKKYFSDYFVNIESKYSSSSSSFATSSKTPIISEPSSISSSIIKPPKLPTVPQSIVNNIAKLMHQDKLNKRGMLIWHSTGSGKTCTATSIMEGFWGTDMDIIYCSKIEALSSNPPHIFYKCATDLFPRFAGKTNSQMEKEFKNIRFLSFAKLANRIVNGTIDLNNCILIIDEVHNLFRPLPNQKKQHEYLEKLLLNEKKFPNLKVFILTATLGDNPNEIIKLLNIVKNNDVEKITIDDINDIPVFKEKIRGLISYFDMSNDRSKFPLVIHNEPKYINMSNKQFEAYIQKYKEVNESHKNYDKLAASNSLYKYWMAARKYSNMLYNYEKGLTLHEFSPKLEQLLESVLSFPDEKQYVYSAFYENRGYGGQGILAVAIELKKRGYEQLTPEEAIKIYNNPSDSDKKQRFILAITTQLGDDKGKSLSDMVKLYNAPFNKNGEYVHLILASQSFNEGLDLRGVRHIHIFEPLITWASDKQTIGRAARNCSHSDLRLKEWTVNIHRYISNFPEEIAQDEGKLQELKNLVKYKKDYLETLSENLKEENTKVKTTKQKIVKIKKDKSISQEDLKNLIFNMNEEIEKYEANIKIIKNVINITKDEIKLINKELKNFDDDDEDNTDIKGKGKKGKKGKKGVKLDPTGVENIDKFIYKQAIDKMKDILTLYQSMQESAVDCLVLNKFHRNGNNNIDCTKY